MTVGQLIEALQKHPESYAVEFSDDNANRLTVMTDYLPSAGGLEVDHHHTEVVIHVTEIE